MSALQHPLIPSSNKLQSYRLHCSPPFDCNCRPANPRGENHWPSECQQAQRLVVKAALASPFHPKQSRSAKKRIPLPAIQSPTRITTSLFLFHDESQGAGAV